MRTESGLGTYFRAVATLRGETIGDSMALVVSMIRRTFPAKANEGPTRPQFEPQAGPTLG